jgi:ATP-binding cassette, subfamily B, bacterial
VRLSGLFALAPFARPYWPRMVMAIVFLVLAAATTLLLPVALRELIDAGLSTANQLPAEQRLQSLRPGFLALLALACCLGLFTAGRYYMVSWLGERIVSDLRAAVYSNVLRLSPESFDTIKTGDVLSRLTADATLVQTVIGSSLSMGLRNVILFLGGLGMLIATGPKAAISLLAVLAVCVIPAALIGKRVRKLSRAGQDRLADSSALAGEVLNAIAIVQGNSQEARESERFATSNEATFSTAAKRAKVRAALTAFIIITIFAGLLFGLYLGVKSVLDGTMSAGTLGQTVLTISIVASSAAVLAEVWGDLLRASGAAQRLLELNSRVPTIQTQPERWNGTVAPHAPVVQFANVKFAYPTRRPQAALEGLSFTVGAGQTIALVGASGAGKTTVFQLLQRFYDADSGVITLNGRDIRSFELPQLREHFSVVTQEATVFSASAADNIRYAQPQASIDQVVAAAKAAHAHEFIEQLPCGYDSELGERGVRLSGGQRQRIAIARAILKNAPILLLDEATSALDSASELAVQQALDAARIGRTTLVIAHRLSTVRAADVILVLAEGRLVERGTHEQLLAQNGVYARLAGLQFTAPT